MHRNWKKVLHISSLEISVVAIREHSENRNESKRSGGRIGRMPDWSSSEVSVKVLLGTKRDRRGIESNRIAAQANFIDPSTAGVGVLPFRRRIFSSPNCAVSLIAAKLAINLYPGDSLSLVLRFWSPVPLRVQLVLLPALWRSGAKRARKDERDKLGGHRNSFPFSRGIKLHKRPGRNTSSTLAFYRLASVLRGNNANWIDPAPPSSLRRLSLRSLAGFRAEIQCPAVVVSSARRLEITLHVLENDSDRSLRA